MKFIFTIMLCLAIAGMAWAQTSELVVEVRNFKNTAGKVKVAVFDSESTYLNESKYAEDTVVYNQESVQLIFRGLPQGEYAISIYHDENDNGKLDTNFIGIPTESYAFSNNASGQFGPPKYEESKFTLTGEKQTQTIKLN